MVDEIASTAGPTRKLRSTLRRLARRVVGPPLRSVEPQSPAREIGRIFSRRIRCLPDYLIIGSQKSGTTSMHIWLGRHPSVAPPIEKEIQFFDRHFSRGTPWYRAHFPTRFDVRPDRTSGHRRITGEATPDYLMNPLTPARVAAIVPAAKLIAFLRDPADRAFSLYSHRRHQGIETLSFESAIEEEESQLRSAADPLIPAPGDESRIYRDRSYLRGGLYAEQLKRWLALFPREQLLILRSEDLFEDASPVFHEILDFLGLPHVWEPHWYDKINAGEYSSLDEGTRRRLVAYFDPHNRELERLLGRSFGWSA